MLKIFTFFSEWLVDCNYQGQKGNKASLFLIHDFNSFIQIYTSWPLSIRWIETELDCAEDLFKHYYLSSKIFLFAKSAPSCLPHNLVPNSMQSLLKGGIAKSLTDPLTSEQIKTYRGITLLSDALENNVNRKKNLMECFQLCSVICDSWWNDVLRSNKHWFCKIQHHTQLIYCNLDLIIHVEIFLKTSLLRFTFQKNLWSKLVVSTLFCMMCFCVHQRWGGKEWFSWNTHFKYGCIFLILVEFNKLWNKYCSVTGSGTFNVWQSRKYVSCTFMVLMKFPVFVWCVGVEKNISKVDEYFCYCWSC